MKNQLMAMLPFLLLLFSFKLEAQETPENIRTSSKMGQARPITQSSNWTPLPKDSKVHEKGQSAEDPNQTDFSLGNQALFGHKNTSTNAFVVNLGRNFEGNHMADGTPSDNNLAISNDGLIVAVDNFSIAYFKENGDTITQFGLPLGKLYSDSTMDRTPFDPRVIYDSYEDRFILVSLFFSNDYRQSRLLLSFSRPLLADTVEWNHYQLDCDSIFDADNEAWYHFDYPNVSVTRSQLIVTCRLANHDTTTGTNPLKTNVIFQIDKASGYTGAPAVIHKAWKDVENTENVKNLNLVPAMDALQGIDSDTTVFFVTNYNSGTKFFWFELQGAVNSPTAQITPHSTLTSFFYSAPSYASQLGGFGSDRISVLDCDIQYALLQNKKLHFVFTRSDNGWAELVYANIDLVSNSFFARTFSGSNASENYLRPSIACFGRDSSDENYMIGFLRTGPNQYPDVCAVNYDTSGFSPSLTVVKQGIGLLNWRLDLVAPWDSLERWGDYTSIQRRYNDEYRRCWMVGAYPFGFGPNHFGENSSVNAWIAELGDSIPALGTTEEVQSMTFRIFPNPAASHQTITLEMLQSGKWDMRLFDAFGRERLQLDFSGANARFSIAELPSGMYFAKVYKNGNNHGTQKLVIHN